MRTRAILFCLAATAQTLRKGSRKGIFSAPYTTVDGCECVSPCSSESTKYVCDVCTTKDQCGGGTGYCDYSASTVKSFVERSVESKTEYFWNNIMRDTKRGEVTPFNINVDVKATMFNFRPEAPPGRKKVIHSVGAVCKFDLDIGANSPYSGLLGPGLQTGFIRMGPAVDVRAGFTPGIGYKFPRTGVHEANFVSLHSLDAIPSTNFFAFNHSNHLQARDVLSPLSYKFLEGSQCPAQVGLSDMARYSRDGVETFPPRFPFKLFLQRNPDIETGQKETFTEDTLMAEMGEIPVGSVLFTVYGCDEPTPTEYFTPTESVEESCGAPVLLGKIVTTSKCTTSAYGDREFHIRHQPIEEDWLLESRFFKSKAYDASDACKATVARDGVPPNCGSGMLETDA